MSNRDSWNDPLNQPPVPAKRRMSGCLLTSLIVGGISLIAIVLCCGVAGWFVSTMMPIASKSPAEVAAVGHQILNTEIMEDFAPDQAFTSDNMIFLWRMALYRHKDGKGEMVLTAVKIKIGDPSQANEQARQLSNKSEEKINGNLEMSKSETRDVMIDGHKVAVRISEGTDRTTGVAVHTAEGDFEQSTGHVFFLIRMDDDVWNEEAVIKMLEDTKPQ